MSLFGGRSSRLRGDWLTVGVFGLVCAALAWWEPRIAGAAAPEAGEKVRARVVSVDNGGLVELGLLRTGSQMLEVEVLGGEHKGERFAACNELRGQLELDKLFVPGDVVLAGIAQGARPGVDVVTAQD